MEEDFSTIEHDFIHTKDYFNNCKFNYKERKSKLDFFQNINSASPQDTTFLLEEAKSKLVEVKQHYKDLDQEIRQQSQEIFDYESKIAAKRSALEELNVEEDMLRKNSDSLAALDEKLRINADLNEELDQIEEEIRSFYLRIDEAKNMIGSSPIENKRREESECKVIKQELAAKQKRLTIINTDCYIEDIYYWYDCLCQILKNIFGSIDVKFVENRMVFKMIADQTQLEISLKDNRMIDASLSGPATEELAMNFHGYKGYCIKINNMLLLVERVFLQPQ